MLCFVSSFCYFSIPTPFSVAVYKTLADDDMLAQCCAKIAQNLRAQVNPTEGAAVPAFAKNNM